jgi:predicted PurR-regulated permease PerM
MSRSPWLWIALLAVCGFLIYLLLPVLMPFVVAAGLAYLGNPIVDRLQGWHLSRLAGVAVVFLIFAGVLAALAFLIVPALVQQFYAFGQNLPDYLQWLHDKLLPRLGVPVGSHWDANSISQIISKHWKQAGGLATHAFKTVSRSGLVFVGVLIKLVIIPVVAFYLLRDWHTLMANIAGLLPRPWLPTARRLANETDEVLGAFVRGQFLVMLALATLFSLGLWLMGINMALLIGTVAGLIEFIPYLGFMLGILLGGAAVLLQTHDPVQLVWVILIFGGGHLLSDVSLVPWLVGNRIGLHPVVVIFAVLAGGEIFGFTGVLLALPVAAVLAVLWRELRRRWVDSVTYSDGVKEGKE